MVLRACCSLSPTSVSYTHLDVYKRQGYLSDVGDIESMAEGAIKLLKDEKTLDDFTARALNHTKNFERDKIVPLYENLYIQVIEEHKKQRQ